MEARPHLVRPVRERVGLLWWLTHEGAEEWQQRAVHLCGVVASLNTGKRAIP